MFDNTCKFLAESFSKDFASWLLGQPISLTQLSPSELSLEPIRADALILLNSDEFVLHIEFQTEPDPSMPFRMTDYRLRVFRRFPQKQMRQVVVYLTPSTSDLVQQTVFEIPRMRHEFDVIRLWEQPTQPFLEATGLLPLAVLTQTANPAQTLRQVASQVEAIDDSRIQSNVAASAGILAGLSLKQEFINQVLRRDIMQQSVIYQEIKDEGRHEGEAGLILRLLSKRFGQLSPQIQSQIQALSLPQLEVLGEALLDFTKLSEIEEWIQAD